MIDTAIVGLGSVNLNLLDILVSKGPRLLAQYGVVFRVLCVADSSGVAVEPNGFDPAAVRAQKLTGGRVGDFVAFRPQLDMAGFLREMHCDLVMEASPVNLLHGEPGLGVVRAALERGVSVVLANKGPLVLAFAELHETARRTGAGLAFSATVCGGLPILNIVRRDLVAADVRMLRGIFNSTSNFILDGMADGRACADALAEAQRRGIAEADPSLDVGGWDSANKLLIVANSVLDAGIGLADIEVRGITDITPEQVAAERAQGRVLKLVAEAREGRYSVAPVPLPAQAFLAGCNGWEMGVEMHSDLYGRMYHKLWEREPVPTAASMLRDAVNLFTPLR